MNCAFCKSPQVVYHVTELTNDQVSEVFHMCERCGHEYMEDVRKDLNLKPKKRKKSKLVMNLESVKTPEDLLELLVGSLSQKEAKPTPPCTCGLTVQEFQKTGRFGCPKCYDHFHEEFQLYVAPYHGANEHVGKRPRSQLIRNESSEDRIKRLKLMMAKAVELEDYEEANKIKSQIEQVNQDPLP